jgi:hypothetical protein
MKAASRWHGRWHCSCGARGEAGQAVFRINARERLVLSCPKCKARIRMDGELEEDGYVRISPGKFAVARTGS